MTAAQEGDNFVSFKHRSPLPQGTHFCQRLSRTPDHSAIGRILGQ